ncbi:hypothetical protein [Anatilimnocola floriformis]|uniref:hypothetical protein n=1 Tax=Anatilimnocola floriformis TaxID=2948575 RepID=UPI0020C25737|nr:hypothetical protein [Anatilimnocola floriformis]
MKKTECLRCGSEKIMYNVPMADHVGGQISRPAQVEIHGNPAAWFNKETAVGQISLTICGECGFAEMYVKNFRELYEKCVQSQPLP